MSGFSELKFAFCNNGLGVIHHELDRYLAGPCTGLRNAQQVAWQAKSLRPKICGSLGPRQGGKAASYGKLR